MQFLTPHKGGQLDTNQSVVTTVLNTAAGLSAEWDSPDNKKWLQCFKSEIFYSGYHLSKDKTVYPYTNGKGLLANVYIHSKWDFRFHITYWRGENFIAPRGGKLYQSVSSIPGMNYKEDRRELLILNFSYEKELIPGLFVDCRYSPYIDFRNSLHENSYLILLSYRNNFRLGSLKKSEKQ